MKVSIAIYMGTRIIQEQRARTPNLPSEHVIRTPINDTVFPETIEKVVVQVLTLNKLLNNIIKYYYPPQVFFLFYAIFHDLQAYTQNTALKYRFEKINHNVGD